ncbi:MAG TPA: alpha/beta hydrolase [Planctomycetota bacterium]|nr:alpha/beta hydrolase [Planctomycetota bacterium]
MKRVIALSLLMLGFAVANWSCAPETGALVVQTPKEAIPVKPKIEVYKKIGDIELNVHTFRAPGEGAHPCVIWFFNGGWGGFDATKVYAHSEYLNSRGVTSIAAEVRVRGKHKTSPREAILDGRSAVRWVRSHAAELGVDPQRIAVSGSSAAGVLSACTVLLDGLEGWDDPADDQQVSARPNAAIPLCACFDSTLSKRLEIFGGVEGALKSSPMHHVAAGAPPMLVIHTRDDESVPFTHAVKFAELSRAAGNRCDLVLWDEGGHGFFGYWDGKNKCFFETLRAMDIFLASLGWVKGDPTIDNFHDTQGLAEEFLRNRTEKNRE